MKGYRLWAAALILCSVTSAAPQENAPPLPPGLEAPPKQQGLKSEPALPAGLEAQSKGDENAPALPPGLIEEENPQDQREDSGEEIEGHFPLDFHGFWELRTGVRVSDDSVQPSDFSLGETRLQLQTDKSWDRAAIEFTGDFLLDGVTEEVDFDLRRLRLTTSLTDNLDLGLGRQVLTWGTGDLLFINDLFPKDWQSFLIGRDVEYLKAPSDALKLSWYNDIVNFDLVYTPQFDSDRFIAGERISFWSPRAGRRIGRDMEVNDDAPDDWFDDDEIAVRLHRTFGSTEVALYGYDGFWKSPAGQDPVSMEATFPRLSVYGASIRGTLGKGVVNAEVGYYDSRDDRKGDDPFVDNSELRFLIGYERELAKEFTGAFQYYLVHMMDYGSYRDTLPAFIDSRDENRHVFTMRITKLLMNQDLTLSSFLFFSPSDSDGYWRPRVSYKINDSWEVSAGGNLFFGRNDYTFYAQFEDNSNVYMSARYSF